MAPDGVVAFAPASCHNARMISCTFRAVKNGFLPEMLFASRSRTGQTSPVCLSLFSLKTAWQALWQPTAGNVGKNEAP
jgi:hypothetical protein